MGKLPLDETIKGPDGEPIENPISGGPLTLRAAIEEACARGGTQQLTRDQKLERGDLAFLIHSGNPELISDDFVTAKAAIGDFWSPVVVRQSFRLIDDIKDDSARTKTKGKKGK